MKRVRARDSVIGRGYVGRWRDGTLGWCMPSHMSGIRTADGPSEVFERNAREGDRVVLCEITVRVVRDSLGREITRKAKRPQQ